MASGTLLTIFGRELRIHRERAGVTQAEVGERVGYGNGQVSKIERGERVPRQELCLALDEMFGTRGLFTRLGADVRENTALAQGFGEYVSREPDALVIQTYATHLVPGLLQTPEYARCVIEAERPAVSDDVVSSRLATRMTRQDVFRSERPPLLWAVIDEAAIHREVGSRDVLAAQLAHVLDQAASPTVTVQVSTYAAGVSAATGVAFLLAEFESGPPAFHVDGPPEVSSRADADTARRYAHIFDHLRAAALPEERSREFIRAKLEELKA